jgi:hypothetical protein
MRIWTLNPKYLDTKGLVALWRETLLAKKVLEGKTRGYNHHPQLKRFKDSSDTLKNINYYLQCVWEEARKRNFNFDNRKFNYETDISKIPVTEGQLKHEMLHLLNKLRTRDVNRYEQYKNLEKMDLHPLFYLTGGGIEEWEKP